MRAQLHELREVHVQVVPEPREMQVQMSARKKAMKTITWTCPDPLHVGVVHSDGGSRPRCRLCGKKMRKVR